MNSLLCGSIVSCEYPDENFEINPNAKYTRSFVITARNVRAKNPKLI